MARSSALRQVDPAPSYVTFARPSIERGEIDDVIETLASGWLTTGPRVQRFEREFAAYVGAREAVAVNSCTAGLHLSLLASGIGGGDEVVTTPLTFCATANTVIHTGARPVFADVDPVTMNLDPAAAAAAVTPRTRAVLPVHFAGRPVDIGAFRALTARHRLVYIEDAAHAVETVHPEGKVGTTADFTCFSFYATKNLTTGEGGMITTASPEKAQWLRTAALHGLSRDAWKRYGPDGPAPYEVVMAGFKYNMMDLQAAIGLRQLARLDEMAARREAIWRAYDEALADLPLVRPAPAEAGTVHARHLYTVLVDPTICGWTRAELQQALHARGIGTSVHFQALHLHAFYAERYGLARGMFPHAEYISDHTLSLPLSAALTGAEFDQVIDALRAIFA
ncbi:MAG: DegT/DnrJ/EryC1/StrS aminotransferase family protein [Vicinamibacterales bacterium]|nr:DegT/DnrJ/EryC1/StrS aminotransferase family protein [Vicinamibacterales bacterium]